MRIIGWSVGDGSISKAVEDSKLLNFSKFVRRNSILSYSSKKESLVNNLEK